MTLKPYTDNDYAPLCGQLWEQANASFAPANLRRLVNRFEDMAELLFVHDGEAQLGEAAATPEAAIRSAKDVLSEDIWAEQAEDAFLDIGLFAEDAMLLIEVEELIEGGIVGLEGACLLALRNRRRLLARMDDETSLGFIALWVVVGQDESDYEEIAA